MPDEEGYRTVEGPGETCFEVRGSQFIGYVRPVRTVEAAESVIDAIGEEYADATHNVPAYRVRADPLRELASDVGEPSGSAGKPALNVLQSEAVENVVAVVTRYYGGTDLGIGGLVRSYSRAVRDALSDAGIVERLPREEFTVTVDYDDSGTVRGIVEGTGDAVAFDASYDAEVRFVVRAPKGEAAELRDRVRSATSGRATIER